jgi:carbamoyltransferase
MVNVVALALSEGKAVGWHQGRMEFGARALGARSILADPRNPNMQKNLNLKIKYRESFRPFAPSVLLEDARQWFNLDCESPYMMIVAEVASIYKTQKVDMQNSDYSKVSNIDIKTFTIPAVTHIDNSARIQTVDKATNKPFYDLLKRFKEITGCPVLINTSFNIRGEPIVNTPGDSFRCFMGTELDLLVIGNIVLNKVDQPKSLFQDYKNQHTLD